MHFSFFFVQDEEINELSQMIERLKEQMLEQEDLISMGKRDYENLQQEMSRIQADNDSAKDEVRVCVGSLCVPVCACVYLCVQQNLPAYSCIHHLLVYRVFFNIYPLYTTYLYIGEYNSINLYTIPCNIYLYTGVKTDWNILIVVCLDSTLLTL